MITRPFFESSLLQSIGSIPSRSAAACDLQQLSHRRRDDSEKNDHSEELVDLEAIREFLKPDAKPMRAADKLAYYRRQERIYERQFQPCHERWYGSWNHEVKQALPLGRAERSRQELAVGIRHGQPGDCVDRHDEEYDADHQSNLRRGSKTEPNDE